MSVALLPCPFCGGSAEIYTLGQHDQDAGAMGAHCSACFASAGRVMWPSMDDPSPHLAEMWNQRQDGCDALKAIIKHWDEFGPEGGLEELIDAARRTQPPDDRHAPSRPPAGPAEGMEP